MMNFSGLRVLVINGYAIRIKKFGFDLSTRNQPTSHVYRFKNQIPFDDFPATHNVEAGYVLNEAGQCAACWLLQPATEETRNWEVLLQDGQSHSVVEDLFGYRGLSEDDEEDGARIRARRTAIIRKINKQGDGET